MDLTGTWAGETYANLDALLDEVKAVLEVTA
jgi:hypothetical protein